MDTIEVLTLLLVVFTALSYINDISILQPPKV